MVFRIGGERIGFVGSFCVKLSARDLSDIGQHLKAMLYLIL